MECNCSERKKKRSDSEHRSLINRLSRIEGQIRGIKGMVERDVYCTDIITQVAAVNAALVSFNKQLLSDHINSCVLEDIKDGRNDSANELVQLIGKLMK